MILFYISAAILVVLCLAWLILGLKRAGNTSSDQEAANILIAREKLATLDSAKASGAVDENAYALERQQLEQALAGELLNAKEQNKENRDGSSVATIFVAIFLPLSAGALYLLLGTPEAINNTSTAAALGTAQTTAGDSNPSVRQAPNLEELLPQLEARLLDAPNDVQGWRLLGRTYLTMSRFDKAAEALEKAVELDDQHLDTIASLAESLAMQKDGDLSGRPLQLINDALTLDENHPPLLWLSAIGAQQTGDHQTALAQFDKLSVIAAGNSEALATIEQMRTNSEQALGVVAEPSVTLEVSVNLSDDARKSVSETDAVFIFARAQTGPPMPLAVSRHTVKDLPITITLDESMAMIPNMTLANFPDVVVGARVSPSGNAIAQTGDWFAESSITITDKQAATKLLINEQTP